MASDKQQVDRMEVHRSRLLAQSRFSMPSQSGRMAILTMYDHTFHHEVVVAEDRLEVMDREARRIQRYLRLRGRPTAYFPVATIEDFWEVLDDETVSDITVIGLAKLGLMHVSPWERSSAPGKKHATMNFFEAIARGGNWPTITHLKQGSFYQRTSGGMDMATLNVPLAWGFMADRAKIWAVPQSGFYPGKWHTRPRTGLMEVAKYFHLRPDELNTTMSYARAKELFGKRDAIRPRGYPVPRFAYPAYDKLRGSERLFQLHQGIRRMIPFTEG